VIYGRNVTILEYKKTKKTLFITFSSLQLSLNQTSKDCISIPSSLKKIMLRSKTFICPNLTLYNRKLPLNNAHLSTTVTNLGSRGWSLYTTLTEFEKLFWYLSACKICFQNVQTYLTKSELNNERKVEVIILKTDTDKSIHRRVIWLDLCRC